ncbi:arsenate reductase/protein-tyrosine-phosphatase family protein [Luteipulveratus flavus]|uniref:Phosphotyrosine protein phosphatase I domain-containing protein n=1 Tax=Luteipulveratus flavus TaxID=3031728 RepID=A0ABT6CDK1_9MICO|nr:hypothetical protein [Luteipulveratus sp. YIM 133296]MDF8266492.1 hypothetical protein [Luteipulveratus sp. YIM 133296]
MSATVLVLCTANRCRSPYAAAVLQRALDERGVRATVRSAGFLLSGQPVPETGVRTLRRRGYDLSEHLSTRLTPALLQHSDLVVTMARSHVREVTAQEPSAWPRTFTLTELATLAPADRPSAEEDVPAWTSRVGAARPAGAALGDEGDVLDPIGRRRGAWKAMADQIEHGASAAVDALAPALRRQVRT